MPLEPSESDSQITHLTNQVEEYSPEAYAEDPDAPKVAIQSVMELTKRQEDRLAYHIKGRLDACSQEMGREELLQANESPDTGQGIIGGIPDDPLKSQDMGRGHLAKRRLHELNYNLKVEWREHVWGGIFAETNYPTTMSRRLVQQQIARAQNYFFATEPWFSAGPEGRGDEAIAKEVDRYAKYKSRKGKVKASLCEAIRQAFIRGEGILKTAYVDEKDMYVTMADVAVSPNGELLVAEDGDYIYKGERRQPVTVPEPVIDPATNMPAVDEMGQPIMQEIETGEYVLARDGVTPMPNNLVYVRRKVKRQITLRRGAQLDLVHYLDFLCPLNAPSVQEADFCAHIYERPALHIAQQVLAQDAPDRKGLILRILRDLTSSTGKAETGQEQYRPEVGERHAEGSEARSADTEPRVNIAECYVRYDVDGDGVEESLFVLYNMKDDSLIYYDYLANITPDGRRPFHIARVNPVDNRWHGLSQMEVFEDQQKLVDLFLNRVVKAASDQATVKFWRPDRTKEGEDDPDLVYNDGSTFTPKDNWKAEDILEVVPIYEHRIEDLMRVMEFAQQNTLNLSGVTGANDADAAGMDTQKTATGIRNIDRVGQELFGPYLQSLDEGLSSAIQAWIALELRNLDEVEVYEYFEGDTRMVGELTPDKVRNLAIDVRLELTRYRNEQQDVQQMQATAIAREFYANPSILQELLAPMYRGQLKNREIADADRVIQPGLIDLSGFMPPGAPGAEMTGTAQPPTAANPVTPVGPKMPGESENLT